MLQAKAKPKLNPICNIIAVLESYTGLQVSEGLLTNADQNKKTPKIVIAPLVMIDPVGWNFKIIKTMNAIDSSMAIIMIILLPRQPDNQKCLNPWIMKKVPAPYIKRLANIRRQP